MRNMILSFIVFIFPILVIAQTPAVIKIAHDTTYRTHQETVMDSKHCSATAIAPHSLITASHCELPTDALYLEGINAVVAITSRIRDDNDHTIYIVDTTFKNYTTIKDEEPTQGKSIFYFGNPGKLHDIFRKGTTVGTIAQSDNEPKQILYDFNIWYGDSGAGIFNESGQLIGILTGMVVEPAPDDNTSSFKLAFSYILDFKKKDIDKLYENKN
jgi:hypothetical protein